MTVIAYQLMEPDEQAADLADPTIALVKLPPGLNARERKTVGHAAPLSPAT